MTKKENLDFIRGAVPYAAVIEQLAEEAAELAHAALKLARIIRNENPAAVSEDLAIAHVMEEITDVSVVLDVLDLYADAKMHLEKLKRWCERLKNHD